MRYPSVTLLLIGIPVILLLLFVYVFGGTLGAGLGGASGGRAAYVDYVVPGILLMAIAGVAQGTAISVAMDMTEGIIARFRTMAISRASVLTGHVLGSMIQTMLGLAVVIGVAVAHRVPARPRRRSSGWPPTGVLADDHPRDHVAVGRARPVPEERRGREQPPHAADPPAVPRAAASSRPTRCRPAWRGSPSTSPSRPIIETLRGLLIGHRRSATAPCSPSPGASASR